MKLHTAMLAGALLLSAACRTSGGSEPRSGTGPIQVEENERGYFVSIAADARSAMAVEFYDKLYDALHTYNRKKAAAAGALSSYLEEHEADNGYTSLKLDGNEVECDRGKCLLRLTGRSVGSRDDREMGFAAALTEALADAGIKPSLSGLGQTVEKTFVLGNKEAMYLSCTQRGVGKDSRYTCAFELEKGLAAAASDSVSMDGVVRGKLTDCSLSPGTIKSANDSQAQTNESGLIPLSGTPGLNGKQVGFIHYIKQSDTHLELLGLYLCGDLGQDAFVISGDARNPQAWVGKRDGGDKTENSLSFVQQDDAEVKLTTKLIESTSDLLTLEVHFRLGYTGDQASDAMRGELYGDDRFYMRLHQAWLR